MLRLSPLSTRRAEQRSTPTASAIFVVMASITDEVGRPVQIEVSGCLTTCMHCWAVGGEHASRSRSPRSRFYGDGP